MTTNWALYDKLLAEKEQETFIVLNEAEKHYNQDTTNVEAEKNYKQALVDHEDAKRRRAAWNKGIEEKLEGIERQVIAKESVHESPNYNSHP